MDNVAVVVLDTLRYDEFSTAFDWLPGRRFTSAFSPSHWTVPVHAALFTGHYASEVGVHSRSPALDCPAPTLAERLSAAGYRTRTFTANPKLHRYDGWERGFDEFVGYASLDAYHPDSFDWGTCFDGADATGYRRYLDAVCQCLRADCDTFRSLREGYDLLTRSPADGGATAVRDRLRASDFGDREFCFLNLTEAHTPYYPPSPGEDPVVVVAADAFTDTPVDLDRARRAYRRSVATLSETYREIFDELRDSFDYVITLSDHGELFGEYDMVAHSFGLYPELTRVPLVVSGPGLEGRENRVVSLLDVHRTVADLTGIEVESHGQNLLDDPQPVDRLVEYHGPLPFHEAQFERRDAPLEALERRRSPLWGFVAADGSYAYETHTEGFQTVGEFDGDPRARLRSLRTDLDPRAVGGLDESFSDPVRERPEERGSA
ncbi:sulfatase-like hydrolase/transferase [Halorientalis pallida]|uniref:Arylsulfatase n=1 Tax=Halorientalis pallida TaxID=2479928 RepID=A0A498L8H2_9EURY|nr:sulfatase-like hydrolase/transferase [Halorientalis pallida]RXK51493.1 arylsulfatase [Halorientalis pallida]